MNQTSGSSPPRRLSSTALGLAVLLSVSGMVALWWALSSRSASGDAKGSESLLEGVVPAGPAATPEGELLVDRENGGRAEDLREVPEPEEATETPEELFLAEALEELRAELDNLEPGDEPSEWRTLLVLEMAVTLTARGEGHFGPPDTPTPGYSDPAYIQSIVRMSAGPRTFRWRTDEFPELFYLTSRRGKAACPELKDRALLEARARERAQHTLQELIDAR